MAMNRDGLQALIASYIHREDLDEVIPGFIELTTQRLSRDLRSVENQVIDSAFIPADEISPLPDDFQNIREISYLRGQTTIKLRSSSAGAMATLVNSGSFSAYYRILGKEIEIKPFLDTDFRIVYFASIPPLDDGDSTNPVLENYPSLYLYGSLIEAYFYTQDAGGHQISSDTYNSEVRIQNARTIAADSGDSPRMQRGIN